MKTVKFLTGCFLALIFVTTAYAQKGAKGVEYPEDIRGVWTTEKSCDPKKATMEASFLSIRKSDSDDGYETTCRPLKVTGNNGTYTIKERCSNDGNFNKASTTKYKREGNTLNVKNSNGYTSKHQKCQDMK